ncbi:hypothetical protein Vafri_2382 [Volvox africanus]|nr:hypothetical protein Vafri_2382 [Volvox africanus]
MATVGDDGTYGSLRDISDCDITELDDDDAEDADDDNGDDDYVDEGEGDDEGDDDDGNGVLADGDDDEGGEVYNSSGSGSDADLDLDLDSYAVRPPGEVLPAGSRLERLYAALDTNLEIQRQLSLMLERLDCHSNTSYVLERRVRDQRVVSKPKTAEARAICRKGDGVFRLTPLVLRSSGRGKTTWSAKYKRNERHVRQQGVDKGEV